MSSPRIISLCPSTVRKINECWQPHHFRGVIKSSRNRFKPLRYLSVIIARIDEVIKLQANLDAHETLLEIRDQLREEVSRNDHENETPTHLRKQEKHLRILNGKIFYEDEAGFERTELLSTFGDSIAKEITLKVYTETSENKDETCRRLGITKGRLIQRLLSYGAL